MPSAGDYFTRNDNLEWRGKEICLKVTLEVILTILILKREREREREREKEKGEGKSLIWE